MAPAVAIRSAPLKLFRTAGSMPTPYHRQPQSIVGRRSTTHFSFAVTRRLKFTVQKLGRFAVKCLADAASDSTTMWF